MLIGTHISLPYITGALATIASKKAGFGKLFTARNLLIASIFGMLPDMLSIHVSQEARHASYTHTIWFILACTSFLPIFGLKPLRRLFPTAVLAVYAVFLHVICDMISGGVPFSGVGNGITGDYYVMPEYWIPMDVFFTYISWNLYKKYLREDQEEIPISVVCEPVRIEK
ncbi:MAG: hypothetical protein HQM10_14180 [Candidatus Riflebacteria bacterium]|nr:hypothetical protein [Candidatus Riflebacteria bacterium]